MHSGNLAHFALTSSRQSRSVLVMSSAATRLLFEFEALKTEEKQEFVEELMHHLPPWDSGPLSDDVVAAAGDQLAHRLEEEESAS